MVDSADALVTCTDCFLYAGGGFGFEFETAGDTLTLAYLKVRAVTPRRDSDAVP